MKQNMDAKKKLVMAAALTGLMAGVTLNPDVSFAGDGAKDAKAEKKADHKCADGSCGDKKDKKAKKDKKEKKADHKCADGSCGDKKDKKAKKDKKSDAE